MEHKGKLLRWLQGARDMPWGADPTQLDTAVLRETLDAITGRVFGDGAYFPVRVDGVEHVPPAPVMVVSNHSGGTTIPDVWGLLWLWYRAFGDARPLHPMAHEMVLSIPALAQWFAQRGVIRADPALARRVLTELRRDLLVLPGGDVDTWRPWTRRYEVEFAGRTGYARTALLARVPIVPVAHAGAHDTLLVLTDGRRIAERLGLRRIFRANVFPIHLSLPWGLAIGPLPHIPVPVTLRYRFGAPIPVPDTLAPGEAPTEAMVREHDAKVRAAVQAGLDALRDEG